jgi:hypothetical protein
MDRPGGVIIGSVGVGLVRGNEKHFTGLDGEPAAIHFRPALSFGAKNQNRFIKAVRPANSMQTRLGIPSEAFDMKAYTKRVTPDLAKQIGRQKMNDLARETLRFGFHRR